MESRNCPYCREEIKSDAVKCRHCGALTPPEKPNHGGLCPYCKEGVKEDAIRCKHCKSDLWPMGFLGPSPERTVMYLRRDPHGYLCYRLGQALDDLWQRYFDLLDSGHAGEANDLMARGIQPLLRAIGGLGCT